MSIDITNAGYLAQAVKNRPLIGWHSVIPFGGFVSTGGSGAENLWSPDTYSGWSQSGTGVNGNIDCFTEGDINYIAIAGHSLTERETELTFEWVDQDQNVHPITGPFIVESDRSLILFFDEISNPLGVRIGIKIATSEGQGDLFISHIKAGIMLALERPEFVGNSPFSRSVEKLTNRSDSGKYLGSNLVSEVRQYNIDQQHNSDSFVREYVEPFLEHCQLIGGGGLGPKGSFFLAWRPEEFPDDVYYCADPDSVTWPSYSRPNKSIGFDWSISGVAEK